MLCNIIHVCTTAFCFSCIVMFNWLHNKSSFIHSFIHSIIHSSFIHSFINEEFLFCQPLETTSKAVDVFQMLIDFFDKTELSWSKLVGVCTDGAPAMIGANSGLISLVKQKIQQFKEHIA